MRVLFIHTRGYHESGPETYLENMTQIFDKNQISYDLFCLDYNKNNLDYVLNDMPKPIGSNDVYSYSDQNLSFRVKFKLLIGAVFRLDVYSRLVRALNEKKYDQIIVLQYFLKLSPSIFLAAKRNSVNIIFRQSDFALTCARNTLYRDGAVCTQCTKNQFKMVTNSCAGGYLASLILYFIYKINHLFIKFTKPTIVWTNKHSFNIGSNANVLKGLNHSLNYTPVGLLNTDIKVIEKNYDYGYIGRLSVDKGVDILLNQILVMENLKANFIFVGNIDPELQELVKDVKIKHSHHTTFINKVPKECVADYMVKCRYLVFMSSWFDNLPNSLVEAYSRGIPCILPDFGCFSEFIPNDFSCLGYTKGSNLPFDELLNIEQVEYLSMSSSVKDIAETNFSNVKHLRLILNETKIN